MNTQWFGIATSDGLIVGVAAPRKTEQSALTLAEKIEGDRHFAVQATSKANAREVAEKFLEIDEAEAVVEFDEFAPTEAELEEAAGLRSALEDLSVIAKARTKEPAPPRPAPKTGTWYGCAEDSDGEAMVTELAYSTPQAARDAADQTLPNSPCMIIAVQARSRDEAIEIYEAVDRADFDGVEIAMSKTTRSAEPLADRRTLPVRSGEFYINRAGTLHAKDDCHFLRRSPAVSTIANRPDAVAELLSGEIRLAWTDGEVDMIADDGKTRVTGYCLYCSVEAGVPARV